MTNSTVSIIIATRNRPAMLQYCLEYVQAQPYPHKEIIVVDSSSNEESERVVAQFPAVLSVRLHGQNNNRPQAKNAGLAVSSGEFIAFIDDDAMVEPGWLNIFLEAYRDETIGAVGGCIIGMPKPHCDLFTSNALLYIRPPGQFITKFVGSSNTNYDVDWLTGGNMSFRRTALEQVGGFDPGYTLTNYREEPDIFLRVKRAGWRVVCNPAMAVVHFSPRSSNRGFEQSPRTQYSSGRNSAYFTIKHFGLNPYTLVWQLILAPARTYGLTIYQAGLLSLAALAQSVGRYVGLVASIRWLLSRQRRAQAAPQLWQSNSSITVSPHAALNSMRK